MPSAATLGAEPASQPQQQQQQSQQQQQQVQSTQRRRSIEDDRVLELERPPSPPLSRTVSYTSGSLYAYDQHGELYLPPRSVVDGLGHRAASSQNQSSSSSSSSSGGGGASNAQNLAASAGDGHRRMASLPPPHPQRPWPASMYENGSPFPIAGPGPDHRHPAQGHRRLSHPQLQAGGGDGDFALIPSQGLQVVASSENIQDLARSQAIAHARQERINQTHARMNSLNLMVSAASLSKTTELQQQHAVFKKDIEHGRRWLASLQHQVIKQEQNYVTLGQGFDQLGHVVQRQSDRMTELDSEVNAQGRRMEEALAEYNERLNRQAQQLRQQQSMIGRVLSVRFKLDFALDLAVVLLAWWVSEARPVHFAVSTLSSWIPGLGRLGALASQQPAAAGLLQQSAMVGATGGLGVGVLRRLMEVQQRHQTSAGRTVATRLLKLVVWWQVVSRLRGLLQAQGFHSSVGSVGEYLQVMRGSAVLGLLRSWHHLRKRAGARAARLLHHNVQKSSGPIEEEDQQALVPLSSPRSPDQPHRHHQNEPQLQP